MAMNGQERHDEGWLIRGSELRSGPGHMWGAISNNYRSFGEERGREWAASRNGLQASAAASQSIGHATIQP